MDLINEQNNQDPFKLKTGPTINPTDPFKLGGRNSGINPADPFRLGGGISPTPTPTINPADPFRLGGGITPVPTPTPGITPAPTPTPAPESGSVNTDLTGDDLKAGKVVKQGMKGDIVGKIQELLIAKGFKNVSKSGNVDKIFGSRTKAMVKDFQRANGLNDDGSVGKDTWPKLNDPNAVGASSNSSGTSGTSGKVYQAVNIKNTDEVPGSDAIIVQESRKKLLRKYLREFK